MTKTAANRGFFKKKSDLVPDETPAPGGAEIISFEAAAPHSHLAEVAHEDDRDVLLEKIDRLEARVQELETKLQLLVTLLTREMSTGLRMGPEGLGRALQGSGLLDD